MQNIKIRRYRNERTRRFWEGWIEPEDGSWILFIPGPDEATQLPHLHIPADAEEVCQNVPAVEPLLSEDGSPVRPQTK